MGPTLSRSTLNRRVLLAMMVAVASLSAHLLPVSALAQTPSATDPLPSWNDGAAKQAIVDLCKGDNRQRESQVRATRGAHRHV